MSTVRKTDLEQLAKNLGDKIDQQGIELRKEIKDQGTQLRKDIKDSTDSVLAVIEDMAHITSNRFTKIDEKLDELAEELRVVKIQINNINSDIDKAFKNKSVTEEETVALIAGQRRLERWVKQIAKETGIKLTA